MEQKEFERSVLTIVAAGVIVAIAEFLVMSLLVNRANIVGFQNGLIAGGGVMVVVAVVVWVATAILRPKDDPLEHGAVTSSKDDAGAGDPGDS